MTLAQSTLSDAWKPCDLRGVFPGAISPALFREIGSAVGTLLPTAPRVVVAGDFRLSTPQLKSALTQGLIQTGALVFDAGQGPTPLAYYAAEQMNADAVLIVTASHNPAAHNGLKLMLGSVPTTPQRLMEIRELVESRRFRSGEGSMECINLRVHYMKAMLKRWRHLQGKMRRRVVLDAGNGAWSELAPVIFSDLGFESVCISCVIDGHFPDRSPDCARASNLWRLRDAVREHSQAIGIAWDGDGDRVAFVDEDGSYVSPDEIAILLAQASLAASERNADIERKIVVDVKCADVVRQAVLQGGGVPLLERTGHAFMRGRMVDEDAALGLDACGHYFFRELNGGDDGLFAAFYLLNVLNDYGGSLRDLRRNLPSIFCTPELRFSAAQLPFAQAADALTRAFPSARAVEIDGLRLLLDDGVVLIRESGTESVLSLRIEGFDRPSYERILAHSLLSLPAVAGLLQRELEETLAN
jgi:phosphomannomutase / phosphoglucomutase